MSHKGLVYIQGKIIACGYGTKEGIKMNERGEIYFC